VTKRYGSREEQSAPSKIAAHGEACSDVDRERAASVTLLDASEERSRLDFSERRRSPRSEGRREASKSRLDDGASTENAPENSIGYDPEPVVH
jgi:hypothetical protein